MFNLGGLTTASMFIFLLTLIVLVGSTAFYLHWSIRKRLDVSQRKIDQVGEVLSDMVNAYQLPTSSSSIFCNNVFDEEDEEDEEDEDEDEEEDEEESEDKKEVVEEEEKKEILFELEQVNNKVEVKNKTDEDDSTSVIQLKNNTVAFMRDQVVELKLVESPAEAKKLKKNELQTLLDHHSMGIHSID